MPAAEIAGVSFVTDAGDHELLCDAAKRELQGVVRPIQSCCTQAAWKTEPSVEIAANFPLH